MHIVEFIQKKLQFFFEVLKFFFWRIEMSNIFLIQIILQF